MRHRVRLSFLILLMSFVLSGQSIVSASASDEPYIYYYSLPQQAFILERADGTDSRILATYMFPENHENILGPGWSYSGEWFAWTSNSQGGTLYDMDVELVNRISGERLTLTPEFGKQHRVDTMLWSPASDLLLVNYAG